MGCNNRICAQYIIIELAIQVYVTFDMQMFYKFRFTARNMLKEDKK